MGETVRNHRANWTVAEYNYHDDGTFDTRQLSAVDVASGLVIHF